MPPPELTLIVAATREMGIGLNGTLPWTGLKKEMAYFARVTKRLSPSSPPHSLNAVIMGRATWDSIPTRFRPLKGRLNVVISRSIATPPTKPADYEKEPVMAGSLEQAVEFLGATKDVGRVFVIGGAQIYGAALGLKETKRVLLTRVLGQFECDTFFPLVLGEGVKGWKRVDGDEWVGERLDEVEEAGTRWGVEMWERERDGEGDS
ncbi:hypothetical protein OQA88_336 [Cercophora sp. LCS_1]